MKAESDTQTHQSIVPYLVVDDVADAITFYERAFDARERFRMPTRDGIGHAELAIGDSLLMLTGEDSALEIYGPRARGGPSTSMILYLPDVDAAFTTALAAGAREEQKVLDQPYGDRSGVLSDPFGHRWILATRFDEAGAGVSARDALIEPLDA